LIRILALKGRHIKHRCDALSGLKKLYAPLPRALPWVMVFNDLSGLRIQLTNGGSRFHSLF